MILKKIEDKILKEELVKKREEEIKKRKFSYFIDNEEDLEETDKTKYFFDENNIVKTLGNKENESEKFEEKKKLIKDAKALETSGAFAIVLECTYSDISKKISSLIKIPTIGIGASVYCDGQVLVTDDILGLTDAKIKFVKKYVNIKKVINFAILKFKHEVKSKKYPTKKYSY